MDPLVDTGKRYPILSDWMKGAGPKHPYAIEFQTPPKYDYGQWDALDRLEALLSRLQRTAPARFDGKRRESSKQADPGSVELAGPGDIDQWLHAPQTCRGQGAKGRAAGAPVRRARLARTTTIVVDHR